jgi:cytochrome c oxidase subunit 1
VLLLLIGGLSGIILASTGTGNQLHNTHFVLAHFHYLLAGCIVMAYLGGLHFWWERIAGHSYPGYFGMISAVLLFAGINLTFFPMFILGFQGMLRRNPVYPEQFEILNIFSTAGMTILLIGYLIPVFYLIGTFHNHGRVVEIPESSA